MFILHHGLYSDLEKKNQNISHKGPPSDSAIFVSGLSFGLFSVPGIYVETYVYDDMYIHIFMTSQFFTSDNRVR